MNNSNIKVTVIIPVFNEEELLKQCLDSVLEQVISFPMEVLVIDDFSVDNTFAVAKSYAEKYPNIVKVFRNDENLGSERAFARGLRLSRGDYFHVLDADDYWVYKKKLQTQVDFLDNHPDYSAVAHNTLVIDFNTKEKNYMANEDKARLLENRVIRCSEIMRGEIYFHTSSILYRNIFKGNVPKFLGNKIGGDLARLKMHSWYGNMRFLNELWSVYQYTGKGIWSSLDREEQLSLNLKAAFFFFRISPLRCKVHSAFYIAKCFNEFANVQYQKKKSFLSCFRLFFSRMCYRLFDRASKYAL